jgi:Xaa-Pro aminopeptidase
MKQDIDRLMHEAHIDALLIMGSGSHNPNMTYFTGKAHLTNAYLLKKVGETPVLFHQSMERDEAGGTGLETKDLTDYNILELLQQVKGDIQAAEAERFKKIFEEFAVKGKVSVYGKVEFGGLFSVLRKLEKDLPELEFIGEAAIDSVMMKARLTKDPQEVERIREMGKITTAVVADVAGFLTAHRAKDGVLVNQQGETLLIGDVKRRINLWLAMRGADNPEGTIFAIGRDAGVPHSTGEAEAPVEIGKTIIFDIFPMEAGGGYFFDFTRTWCLGYASDEALQLHQDVLDVYNTVYQTLKLNTPCRTYQIMTCEAFEERGHPTVLNTPRTQEGYVHSLAHGLGLQIHEGPNFRHTEDNTAMLEAGTVFTFEPGLYYPDQGMGVRIEDTLWASSEGAIEPLVEYPKDLVLPIQDA